MAGAPSTDSGQSTITLSGVHPDALMMAHAATTWLQARTAEWRVEQQQQVHHVHGHHTSGPNRGTQTAAPRLIAISMGAQGTASRVLNRVLTPVTHPSLPVAAAPGQLSVQHIQRARVALGWYGQVPSLQQPQHGLVSASPAGASPQTASPVARYCLFGSPIKLSPSPAMQNAAFDQLLLPFVYERCETTDPAVVLQHLCSAYPSTPGLGGAALPCRGGNVTVPLKKPVYELLRRAQQQPQYAASSAPPTPAQSVDQLVDTLARRGVTVSAACHAIGAVNTIAIDHVTGHVEAHNTDWLGIYRPLRAVLPEADADHQSSALVIGAGGTARAALYALQQVPSLCACIQSMLLCTQSFAVACIIIPQLGYSKQNLLVFNRTASKAISLASQFGCSHITSCT